MKFKCADCKDNILDEYRNNKYDYSLVECSSNKDKVKIICPIHGEFEQTPNAHLYAGSGCEKCAREARRKETISE
mgnify:CR=1 FL=1